MSSHGAFNLTDIDQYTLGARFWVHWLLSANGLEVAVGADRGVATRLRRAQILEHPGRGPSRSA